MKRIFWNAEEDRIRSFWRVLIVLWSFVTLTLVFQIFPFVLNMIAFLRPVGIGISAVLSILGFGYALWAFGRFIDRRTFADFGFHFKRAWWIDFAFGLALGASLMCLIFLAELACGWITIRGYFVVSNGSFGLEIANMALFFLAVGIREEMAMRASLLRTMAEGLNKKSARGALIAAYAISSVLFGLLHLANPDATWVSTANIMLAGVFLGLGLVLTGEMAIPIGLHIAWNFFQGNVFGFPVSGNNAGVTFIAIQQGGPVLITGGAFGPEAGLVGIAAILLGAGLILAWVRVRRGQARLQTSLAVYQPKAPAKAD
jgi:membrane protease YdiL (CAAX protease family)